MFLSWCGVAGSSCRLSLNQVNKLLLLTYSYNHWSFVNADVDVMQMWKDGDWNTRNTHTSFIYFIYFFPRHSLFPEEQPIQGGHGQSPKLCRKSVNVLLLFWVFFFLFCFVLFLFLFVCFVLFFAWFFLVVFSFVCLFFHLQSKQKLAEGHG